MGSGAAAFLASRFRAPVRLRFRFAQATPDTLRSNGLRVAAPRVARKGEAWWARQDSNLQPDRYERSALPENANTISVSQSSSGRFVQVSSLGFLRKTGGATELVAERLDVCRPART